MGIFKKDNNDDGIFEDKHKLEVIRTNNYGSVQPDWFWNRPLNSTTIEYKKILDSMDRNGFYPREAITVNAERWITGGNHRYHAAKQLGIPFYYYISDHITKENIILDSNQGRNWTIEEAFNLWLKHGRYDYVQAQKLISTFKLPISIATSICLNKMGGKNVSQIVKDGKMVVTEGSFKHSYNMCKQLDDVRRNNFFVKEGWTNNHYFISAIITLMRTDGYDHKRMVKALKFAANIFKVSTKDGWTRQLVLLYNRGLAKTKHIIIV